MRDEQRAWLFGAQGALKRWDAVGILIILNLLKFIELNYISTWIKSSAITMHFLFCYKLLPSKTL